MSELEIYLILKLDMLIWLCGLSCAFFIFCSLVLIIGHNIARSEFEARPNQKDYKLSAERWEKKRPRSFITIPLGILFFVISIFIPTTKEFVIIKVAPAIVNNEQVQELPDNLMKFINGWIKEYTPKNEK